MGCWDLPLGTEVLPVPIVMALTPPSPVGRLAGLDQDPPSAVICRAVCGAWAWYPCWFRSSMGP